MKVFVFGSNEVMQLGLGEDVSFKYKPVLLECLNDKDIVQISAGGLHSLALTRDGRVYSWGCNDEKALGRDGDESFPALIDGLTGITQIATGDSISAALTADGKVYTWGTYRDSNGLLGFSPQVEIQARPVLIELMSKSPVIQLHAGTNHVLALTEAHELFSWGAGERGQLGRKILKRHKKQGLIPVSITARRSKEKFTLVESGDFHCLAVTESKKLFAWGLNCHGQLGLGDCEDRDAPEQVELNEDVVQLAAGEHHSIVVTKSGKMYGFGRSDDGQLARDEIEAKTPVLMKVPTPRLLCCGSRHALAVVGKGDVYAWGFGDSGQLGLGNGEAKNVDPKKINFAFGNVVAISAGAQHSMILTE